MIELDRIVKRYRVRNGQHTVLNGVSLRLGKG